MNQINASTAAALFLLARGRHDPSGEDRAALTCLLSEFALAGFSEGLRQAKEIHRSLHPGDCRIFSDRDCECFLCQCDQLLAGQQ